jgi:DNA-binding MarR family transcriptional regulator
MSEPQSIVDRALGELTSILARQRQQMVRYGCMRAVSSGNLHVLMLLDNEGPLPMSRLAEQLDASLPNLTGIVGRMEERGLLERVRDLADRRVVNVRITDAGRTTMQEVETVKLRNFRLVLEAMTPSQQATCLTAFRALHETADRLDAQGVTDPQDHHHPHQHPHPHIDRAAPRSQAAVPAS